MPKNSIQEQFGQAVIEQLTSFARADIKTVAALEAAEFSHVTDAPLRHALAQTMYGARWVYKLGLALLTEGDERIAHVRTQVLDYGSICESLLKFVVGHGIQGSHFAGPAYTLKNATNGGDRLNWSPQRFERTLKDRNYWWLIEVAHAEGIIDQKLAKDLHRLREHRNTVHLTELTRTQLKYVLGLAKSSLATAHTTIAQTKAWIAKHP